MCNIAVSIEFVKTFALLLSVIIIIVSRLFQAEAHSRNNRTIKRTHTHQFNTKLQLDIALLKLGKPVSSY